MASPLIVLLIADVLILTAVVWARVRREWPTRDIVLTLAALACLNVGIVRMDAPLILIGVALLWAPALLRIFGRLANYRG